LHDILSLAEFCIVFVCAFFLVTFSGNGYYLPPKAEIILGRSDSDIGMTVDVDLARKARWLEGCFPVMPA
jgi:hypothetical protein